MYVRLQYNISPLCLIHTNLCPFPGQLDFFLRGWVMINATNFAWMSISRLWCVFTNLWIPCLTNMTKASFFQHYHIRSVTKWLKKNIKRHTANTIVSWPNPKQWIIVHTSDLMMIIRQSNIHICIIIPVHKYIHITIVTKTEKYTKNALLIYTNYMYFVWSCYSITYGKLIKFPHKTMDVIVYRCSTFCRLPHLSMHMNIAVLVTIFRMMPSANLKDVVWS